MKAYILKDSDFDELFAAIDRDPQWGTQGGSSGKLSPTEQAAHETAHRFFNYQLRTWAEKVRR